MEGLLPLPRREDAELSRLPRGQALQVLRLRRVRRRLQVPAEARGQGVPGGGEGAGSRGGRRDPRGGGGVRRGSSGGARSGTRPSPPATRPPATGRRGSGARTARRRGATSRGAASRRSRSQRFRLGVAADEWNDLPRRLAEKGIGAPALDRAGLVVEKEKGGGYDRFRGRLMFPIAAIDGQVIGFGGRALRARTKGREVHQHPGDRRSTRRAGCSTASTSRARRSARPARRCSWRATST